MDERNNFDDIILDKSNKSEKVKKLLLRIIALAILFLVVLIVMKLLSDSEPQQNALAPLPNEPAGTDTEFENIPITSQNATEFDEFELFKLRMQGLEENNSAENNQSFAMPLNEYNASVPVPSEPAAKPTQPAKPATKPTTPAQKPATKPADKPKTTQKSATATTQKPATKPAEKPAQSADSLQSGSYVQVFSVKNFDTKSRELALVTKNGYKYSTRKKGDTTQILIGPFSQDELATELPKIRQIISKDAFVVSVK